MAKLLEVLKTLDGNMLLNDGAVTRDVYNTIELIEMEMEEGIEDEDVVIFTNLDDTISIFPIGKDGFMTSVALFKEEKEEE